MSTSQSVRPILRTIHGSHLYGLAHMNSDMDTFTVVEEPTFVGPGGGTYRALQTVDHEGGTDDFMVGFPEFMKKVEAGSHQSVEALFSRVKAVDPDYEAFFRAYRVTSPDALHAYERTIRKFAHWGDEKRRRHSMRLAYNLRDLREDGRFDPTLDGLRASAIKFWAQTEEATFMMIGQICGLELAPDEPVL